MGMSIDECIDILSYPTYYCSHLREKALDMTFDTMRKYQKIQEIVKRWVDVDLKDSPSIADTNTIEEILEVVEDGKID